ncbi:MAG: UbiA family prenyltransferase [Paracoccaceae bacterium]
MSVAGTAAPRPRLSTLLALGRVSNLPTVWTNALAGAVLASAAADTAPSAGVVLAVAATLSLFYVGGMWLNDAFDAEFDRRHKTDRPIARGEIGRSTVYAVGSGLVALGVLAGAALGAPVTALALAAAVVAYDALHKRVAWGPVMMGATRLLCYALAAAALTGALATPVALAGAGLFAYVVGLTYAAKNEAYDRLDGAWPLAVLALPVVYAGWQATASPAAAAAFLAFALTLGAALRRLFRRAPGDVPKAVVTMIAGMARYDATLVAAAGETGLAALCAAGIALTLALQRIVSGT